MKNIVFVFCFLSSMVWGQNDGLNPTTALKKGSISEAEILVSDTVVGSSTQGRFITRKFYEEWMRVANVWKSGLNGIYQPLENQRLSTGNGVGFVSVESPIFSASGAMSIRTVGTERVNVSTTGRVRILDDLYVGASTARATPFKVEDSTGVGSVGYGGWYYVTGRSSNTNTIGGLKIDILSEGGNYNTANVNGLQIAFTSKGTGQTITTLSGVSVGVPTWGLNNYGFNVAGALNKKIIDSVGRVGNVVTIRTTLAHGYLQNNSIYVRFTTNTALNGQYTVTNVPDANTLTFTKTGTDIARMADVGEVQQMGVYGMYVGGDIMSYYEGRLGVGLIPTLGDAMVMQRTLNDVNTSNYSLRINNTFGAVTSNAANVGIYQKFNGVAGSVYSGGYSSNVADGTALTGGGWMSSHNGYTGGGLFAIAQNNYLFKGNVNVATGRTIDSIERIGGVVRVRTTAATLVGIGDKVYINSTLHTQFNGVYVVTSINVPSVNNFTYALAGADMAVAKSGGTATQVGFWNNYNDGTAPNYFNGNIQVGTVDETGGSYQMYIRKSFAGNFKAFELDNTAVAHATLDRGVDMDFSANTNGVSAILRSKSINTSGKTKFQILNDSSATSGVLPEVAFEIDEGNTIRVGKNAGGDVTSVLSVGGKSNFNNNYLAGVFSPKNATDGANKGYVDSSLQYLSLYKPLDTAATLIGAGHSFVLGSFPESDPTKRLLYLTNKKMGFKTTESNLGVNNTFFNQLPSASIPTVSNSNNVVVLMYGVNEVGYYNSYNDLTVMKTNATNAVNTIKNKGYALDKIIIVSPTYTTPWGFYKNYVSTTGQPANQLTEARLRVAYDYIKQVALETGVVFCDVYDLTRQDTTLLWDGLHLNSRGAEVVSSQIASTYRKMQQALNYEIGYPLTFTSEGAVKVNKYGAVEINRLVVDSLVVDNNNEFVLSVGSDGLVDKSEVKGLKISKSNSLAISGGGSSINLNFEGYSIYYMRYSLSGGSSSINVDMSNIKDGGNYTVTFTNLPSSGSLVFGSNFKYSDGTALGTLGNGILSTRNMNFRSDGTYLYFIN